MSRGKALNDAPKTRHSRTNSIFCEIICHQTWNLERANIVPTHHIFRGQRIYKKSLPVVKTRTKILRDPAKIFSKRRTSHITRNTPLNMSFYHQFMPYLAILLKCSYTFYIDAHLCCTWTLLPFSRVGFSALFEVGFLAVLRATEDKRACSCGPCKCNPKVQLAVR